MKYNCKTCSYETEDRTAWYNHKKTKKHIKLNENNDGIEKHHNINLLNSQHEIELLKQKLKAFENEKRIIKEHYEKQIEASENEKKIIKEHLEKQIEAANKHVEAVNKHVESLQLENQFQKQIINSAGGMIKKSMNTLSYLLLNYKNAPHIKELSDYSIICKNITELVKNLTYYHDKNKLDKFIGDFIIKQYKREEPELQSIWSSDTDRLNYFICELIKEQKTQWVLDKKGIKMSKYIIKPLLEYIHSMNSNYINQKNEEIIDNDTNVDKILKEMQILASINADIKNNKLST